MAVAIMAHRHREAMALGLSKRVDAWVTFDHLGSRWDTGRRAWLSLENTPEPWAMVLQDDAIPARYLVEMIPHIRRHIPEDSPLVLYAGSTAKWAPVFKDVSRETRFLVMERIWWGVGIVLPTESIGKAIAAGDEAAAKGSDQYDHLLGTYFTDNRIPVYYTWPSIVQHRNTPSLVPGRVAGRHAYRYAPDTKRVRWSPRTLAVEAPV